MRCGNDNLEQFCSVHKSDHLTGEAAGEVQSRRWLLTKLRQIPLEFVNSARGLLDSGFLFHLV